MTSDIMYDECGKPVEKQTNKQTDDVGADKVYASLAG